ncbi:TRAP transporter small permease subunit [Celeribacter sp.]|uniref:TRAP transporter small permease subunit n=1 Tax=Celeribacter sp. TaxID=1890673 RepID=UPI003A95D8C3
MTNDSVWLGSLRGPVKKLAIGFTALALAVFAWLAINKIFSADAIGMHELIRSTGGIWGKLMLGSLAGSILFASIYLSDTIGAIEDKPHGFFDYLSLVTSRIAMIAIVMIVVVMFYEVVSRYAFNKPTLWANELSLWIAAFVFLLAGQYAMQQRSHIRIYVIYDLMPRWMKKTADVISVFLIWVFCFALVWGGFNDAWTRMLRMETFGTAWDPPIPGTIKPAILFIIVLVAVQSLSNLIADWHKDPEHHSPADEIDEEEIAMLRKTLGEDL